MASQSFYFEEKDIHLHLIDIFRLKEIWEQQGYIEIVDSNHSGFRAYGIAKDSNKYPNQYKDLYHARLKNNSPDPLIILRITEDQNKKGYFAIKILTLAKHSNVFDQKNNDLLKDYVINILKKSEKNK
ncbi:hypothetical protein B0187_09925 [Haemophilus paracuniculus]|uniref:Uncharacterized protein n=1 Tax=Haemophilus paracuniculus TaxID=734 RepID=A0A1T0AMM5_9PAST|nr:hypothetical protein [Haemophilus paracuniculus]OOR97181.1 hypothetical protein B0187_09925 [Haemophilus paracuniculus]